MAEPLCSPKKKGKQRCKIKCSPVNLKTLALLHLSWLLAQVSATHLMLTGKAYNPSACCTQGIVEQYRGSSILEVQARSCEYSHMFKLDGMRAALLEHIPPLDESTYTRNLGNSQVIDGAAAAQVTSPLLFSCLHCCCCCQTCHACDTLAEPRRVTVKSRAGQRCCNS